MDAPTHNLGVGIDYFYVTRRSVVVSVSYPTILQTCLQTHTHTHTHTHMKRRHPSKRDQRALPVSRLYYSSTTVDDTNDDDDDDDTATAHLGDTSMSYSDDSNTASSKANHNHNNHNHNNNNNNNNGSLLTQSSAEEEADTDTDTDTDEQVENENENESLFSTDHYFDHASSDDEDHRSTTPFIFTDEESASSVCSSSHGVRDGQPTTLAAAPPYTPYTPSSTGFWGTIPTDRDWSDYNKLRGRQLAQRLLTKLSDENDRALVARFAHDIPNEEEPPPRALHKSFVGRAVRNLRRLRPLRSATHQHQQQQQWSSLSTTRNRNADFVSWERRVVVGSPEQNTKPSSHLSHLIDTLVESTLLSHSFHHTPSRSRHAESSPRSSHAMATTPSSGGGVPVGTTPPPPPTCTVVVVSTTALFCRATAEDIAVQMGLPLDDTTWLLKKLRGTAGVFDEEEEEETNGGGGGEPPAAAAAKDDTNHGQTMPMLLVADGFWIPHFEEYVFRMVHSFGRRLCAAP
jgi:hypothetical protein